MAASTAATTANGVDSQASTRSAQSEASTSSASVWRSTWSAPSVTWHGSSKSWLIVRPGCRKICCAFPAGRSCEECGDCGSFRAFHYEPDRAQIGSDGTEVYPGRELVPGEFRGQARAVIKPRCCRAIRAGMIVLRLAAPPSGLPGAKTAPTEVIGCIVVLVNLDLVDTV